VKYPSFNRGSTVVKVLCYKSEGRWFDPSWFQSIFIDIKFFRSQYGPGVDSASNRNEYEEYFPGGKGGRCVSLTTYHHPVPLLRNLGTLTSWNTLGPSGPVTGLLYLYLYPSFKTRFVSPVIPYFILVTLAQCCPFRIVDLHFDIPKDSIHHRRSTGSRKLFPTCTPTFENCKCYSSIKHLEISAVPVH